MKKSLVALAALAVVGAASAQSSVTIYGQLDMAVSKYKDAGAALNPGGASNSRLGFRGVEDLGGGTAAFFDFQHRFSADTGNNDADGTRPFWQGQAFVGLRGGFGEVKLGRQLTAFQDPQGRADPWAFDTVASVAITTTGYATQPNAARPGTAANPTGISAISGQNGGGGNSRTDSITYTSPSFGGFTVSGSYGFKNSADGVGVGGATTTAATEYRKALVSVWGAYANGPLYIGAGAEQNRFDDKIVGAIATYNFGVATLTGGLARVEYSDFGTAAQSGVAAVATQGAKRNNWTIGVTVPVDAFAFKVGYGQSELKPVAGGSVKDTKKLGLGVDYNLSKRTKLYADLFNNKGETAAGVNVVPKSGFDLGVKHVF